MNSNDKSFLAELKQRAVDATSPEELQAIADQIADIENGGSGGKSKRWIVETLADVAKFFRVSNTTIQNWKQQSVGMPGVDGAYDLSEICEWRRSLDREATSKTQEQRDLELRELAAEVASKELKLRKNRGELISRDASKAATASILNEARVQLEAIPSILGASIPPDLRSDLVHELEQQIKLICRKMASKAAE